VITPRSRALLDRYALASRALSRESGERMASEPGQSVEFHDFRAYQFGDELRYVDWRVYARTGRLMTRLFQAERSIRLHLVLDTSASMLLGGKARYARLLAQLLVYVAQRDAPTQVHLLDGRGSRTAQGLTAIGKSWRFLEEAETLRGDGAAPISALKRFALELPPVRSAALALVVSDFLEDAPLQGALAALRARGLDASLVQVMSEEDLEPSEGQLELVDIESGERLQVGPQEVRAYREEAHAFVRRTRAAAVRAGFRHLLLRVPTSATEQELERHAFAALVREGVLIRR
jgi:uncharacterized protein (DUF58 family)